MSSPRSNLVKFNPVLSVAGAYSANDYVGVSSTTTPISGCVGSQGGTGTILSAVLEDKALQSVATELWLFDTAITPPLDNAAWTLSDADGATCVAIIPFSTWYASALNSFSPVANIGMGFKCVAGSTSLYPYFVTRGAPTYASLDLLLRMLIWWD
jgi:hypothetical protein